VVASDRQLPFILSKVFDCAFLPIVKNTRNHYDWSLVNNKAARLENMVASHY